MLQILSGWCPAFPRLGKNAQAFLLAPTLTILCGLGCSAQSPHLLAKDETRQARETELDTQRLFPAQFADSQTQISQTRDARAAETGLAAAHHPTVSRFQKPETEPARKPNSGSLLDLVSYNAVVPGNTETAARIRATVNGAAILDEEVREAVYPYLMATRDLRPGEREAKQKEIFEQELKHLIEREIILQEAFSRLKDRPLVLEKFKEAASKEFDKKAKDMRTRAKLKTEEEFQAWLKAQGLTLAAVRRQMERSFMAQEYMRSRVADALERITHEQIEEYYKLHPEEFQVQDNVVWNDIFIDAAKFPSRDAARQFAERLIVRARAGEDFVKLVNQYDNGDSSYRNGEGYGHRRGEIKPPEAEAMLFNMQQSGEIGPLVENAYGYHVIRLVKREYAGVRPFDEKTQRAVQDKLRMAAYEREAQKVLAELKRKATIEVSSSTP